MMQPRPPEQSLIRRVMRLAIVPILLGLLTVPVAALVGIILFSNGKTLSSTTTLGRSRAESRGWTWYDTRLSKAEADADVNAAVRHQLRECLADTYIRPPWLETGDSAPAETRATDLHIEAWGVPFRSFWGWRARGTFASQPIPPGTLHCGGDLLPYIAPSRVGTGTRIIPFLPLGSGLIANTALYAIAWGAVFALARASRRSLRRRRGLCPACAYDLRATPPGLPCPECGAAIR